MVDVDPRTIHNIENYKGNPVFILLVLLIRTLNIDPNKIFYPENQCERPNIRRVCKKIEGCSEQEVRELEPVIDALIKAFKEKGKKLREPVFRIENRLCTFCGWRKSL